jgi:hypothetical protein
MWGCLIHIRDIVLIRSPMYSILPRYDKEIIQH